MVYSVYVGYGPALPWIKVLWQHLNVNIYTNLHIYLSNYHKRLYGLQFWVTCDCFMSYISKFYIKQSHQEGNSVSSIVFHSPRHLWARMGRRLLLSETFTSTSYKLSYLFADSKYWFKSNLPWNREHFRIVFLANAV